MTRPVHLNIVAPRRTAACGIEPEAGEFYSGTEAKIAVTCLDCRATPAYATAVQRLSLTPARMR